MKICFQKPKQNKTTTKKAKKRLFLRESNPRPSTRNGYYVVGCFAVLCVITLKELRTFILIFLFSFNIEWRCCELQKKSLTFLKNWKMYSRKTSKVLTVYKGRTFHSFHRIGEEHMADKCLAKPSLSLLLMALYSLQFSAFTRGDSITIQQQ